MNTMLFALWFFLPAGVANMIPVFAAKVFPNWEAPLDFGLSIKGKRIFGDHKTVRGVLVGILLGMLVAYVQYLFYKNSSWFRAFIMFDYMKKNPLLFGFLLSFGALFGDAIKSFFKRQVGVASGKTWFPFDQLDYIVGGVVGSLLMVRLNWTLYIIIFFLYFLLHLVSTTIGYLVGLKKSAL